MNGIHEGCWIWKNELLDIFDSPLDVGFSEGFQIVQNWFFISFIYFDAHFLDFLLYLFPTDMLNDVVLFGFYQLVVSLDIWTVEVDRVGLETFKGNCTSRSLRDLSLSFGFSFLKLNLNALRLSARLFDFSIPLDSVTFSF
jgi:hypothetical protein